MVCWEIDLFVFDDEWCFVCVIGNQVDVVVNQVEKVEQQGELCLDDYGDQLVCDWVVQEEGEYFVDFYQQCDEGIEYVDVEWYVEQVFRGGGKFGDGEIEQGEKVVV